MYGSSCDRGLFYDELLLRRLMVFPGFVYRIMIINFIHFSLKGQTVSTLYCVALNNTV